ncbi:O-antigen polymerase [Clostridium perfringens]|uniref:O-antigen polymerase n=1 Tax=Clostridium perfringens TaxID=1502 RepID=UPI003219149D
MGNTLITTYLIYFIMLLFILLKINKIWIGFSIKSILIYLSVLIFILINYILFKKTRIYYQENIVSLICILIFYLPIGILSIRIENFEYIFKYIKPIAIATPFAVFIGLNYLQFEKFLSYMQVSNIILPGMLALYYLFIKEKNMLYLAIWILCFIIQLIYGSRTSLISAIIYMIILELVAYKNNKILNKLIKTIFFSSILTILVSNFQNIVGLLFKMTQILGFGDSRTLEKLLNYELFISNSRNQIYDYANIELMNLGIRMNGIFGDRVALKKYDPNIVYVHNIFYEVLLSFGFLLGSTFFIIFIVKFLFTIISKKDFMLKQMVIFYFCLIFIRLLVSGSFVIEGDFTILIFLLFNRNAKGI